MKTVTASETRPKLSCAECGLTNDCRCLDQLELLDQMVPVVRQVLEHLATDGSFLDIEIEERLALLVDRNDQREREVEAQWSDENDQEDRDLIEEVVGCWGNKPTFRRDVEGIAKLRKVPVERLRALIDRFLRDSRPDGAAPAEASGRPFSCSCSGDHGQTGCSGVGGESGLCAWCVTNHSAPAAAAWPAWARGVDAAVERRAA